MILSSSSQVQNRSFNPWACQPPISRKMWWLNNAMRTKFITSWNKNALIDHISEGVTHKTCAQDWMTTQTYSVVSLHNPDPVMFISICKLHGRPFTNNKKKAQNIGTEQKSRRGAPCTPSPLEPRLGSELTCSSEGYRANFRWLGLLIRNSYNCNITFFVYKCFKKFLLFHTQGNTRILNYSLK